MKKKRINLLSILLLLFLGLYIFTPLGFHVQVWMNRLISHHPEPAEERAMDVPDIGDWVLKDLEGDTFRAATVQGEVVLLNFWASWCPPCVAEMPSLNALYGDYKDQVRFLFIAKDQKDRVMSYLNKEGYEFPVYFEKGLSPNAFNHRTIPTTYVLDKSGKIVVAHSGVADWNAPRVRELLDSLLTR